MARTDATPPARQVKAAVPTLVGGPDGCYSTRARENRPGTGSGWLGRAVSDAGCFLLVGSYLFGVLLLLVGSRRVRPHIAWSRHVRSLVPSRVRLALKKILLRPVR